jgi:hypothetical protein
MAQRRFPPPWKAEEHDTCFIVKDHTGLNLAYVYFQRLCSKATGILDLHQWSTRPEQ